MQMTAIAKTTFQSRKKKEFYRARVGKSCRSSRHCHSFQLVVLHVLVHNLSEVSPLLKAFCKVLIKLPDLRSR
jgi:hypothetical protein